MFMKNFGKFVLLFSFVLGMVSTNSFGMKGWRGVNTIRVIPNDQQKFDCIDLQPRWLKVIDNPDALRRFLCQHIDENTLVVFDCDEVLLTDYGTRPLNNKINDIVKSLQDGGIRVLVLTAVYQLDERINQLKRNGFHFENSWPGVDAHEIVDGLGFKDGVIISGEQGKGAILEVFLEYLSRLDTPIRFNKIIFIDDYYENIKAVKAVQSMGLCDKFWGVHYREKGDSMINMTTIISPKESIQQSILDFVDKSELDVDKNDFDVDKNDFDLQSVLFE